ncbi:MAG TPA: UDP-N-acetylmuramoyl-L-alanine--D-glutamate ligase [Bdellovibrionota bacterium]|jgi:UDP-N-acetylmuramoylalanine--D-glutamate ligase|nr:UDP-N-acetylmuramoyl-L-alanine--D-glutamate ligase [Bdellovibrionota bacterium]
MKIFDPQSKVLIVGLGKSGLSSKRLLTEVFGFGPDQLKTFDESPAKTADFQKPAEALGFDPDFVVLSPGYPRGNPWIQSFLQHKSDRALYSELDLAHSALVEKTGAVSEKVIGITGSAGKSTTAAMLARAIEVGGKKVFLGGNYGIPLADYAYDVLTNRRERAEILVLELSSYQLESLRLGVDIGVITSFSRNHLDRYASVEEYYEAKASLWDRCSGAMILNPSSPDLVAWFTDEFYRDDRRLWWAGSRPWTGQRLLGKHNEQNLDLAAEVLDRLQMPPISYSTLMSFEGLPHRLENCGFRDGVLFVNDSKATTIDSVLVAVEAMRTAGMARMHLLLGGRDKDLPWEDLAQLQKYPFIRAWFFGESAERAQKASGLEGTRVATLREFFEKYRYEKQPGDVVLLSPGGSSLDQYKSFEERGNEFKSLVNEYILNV